MVTLGEEIHKIIMRASKNAVSHDAAEAKKKEAQKNKWNALSIEQKMNIIKCIYVQSVGAKFQKNDFIEKAFQMIESWLSGKFAPKNWLCLRGNIGTGKSRIAQAICTAYNRVNSSVYSSPSNWQIYTAQRCVAAMKIESETNEYSKILKCQKLFIDDIGTEFNSDRYYQVVFGNHRNCIQEILFERYSRNLPTIITSNLTSTQIEKIYGSRILDRLKEKSVLIGFEGESYRNND